MKLKFNPKNKKSMANPLTLDLDANPTSIRRALAKFNAAFAQAQETVIDRHDEFQALKLCLLTGQHLMLEGLHGIAKSMLAENVFKRITGGRLYEMRFMKTTQTDEIFGPMDAEKYKKEATWEYNTAGMLPEAHFAYLDEVYRASEHALPALLGIMNERTFKNGATMVRCPLITAIGTTNFTLESNELDAFHDRWLVKSVVKPLTTSRSRNQMLLQFLERITPKDDENEEEDFLTVSLQELNLLRRAVRSVSMLQQHIELYEEMSQLYVKGMDKKKGFYISDRRLCLSLLLCKAALLCDLHDSDNPLDRNKNDDPEYLFNSRFGLTLLHEPEQSSVFEDAYFKIVGNYAADRRSEADIKVVESHIQKFESLYSETLTPERAEKLKVGVEKLFQSMQQAGEEVRPKSPRMLGRWESVLKRSESLLLSLNSLDGSGGKKPARPSWIDSNDA